VIGSRGNWVVDYRVENGTICPAEWARASVSQPSCQASYCWQFGRIIGADQERGWPLRGQLSAWSSAEAAGLRPGGTAEAAVTT